MPKVLKGNKQLTVDESKVEEFLQLGYSQIDADGKIIKAGKATTLKELKAENNTIKAEIARIKAENEKFKKSNEKLKSENEKIKTENGKIKSAE